ncbi:hypothetical protein [Streptomyces sp. LN704]
MDMLSGFNPAIEYIRNPENGERAIVSRNRARAPGTNFKQILANEL